MDNGLMSIGKAAEMSHLSVATLRLYDELGLLKPKYKDPETGYRYYDIAQNARLDMIVYMKELGMSLTEIGDVLEKEDIVLIETILTQKNEQLHRQMRELRAQHDAVERAIASIERYRKSPETGTVVLEYIDRRYIWGVPCACNFYEEGLRAFEQELVVLAVPQQQLCIFNLIVKAVKIDAGIHTAVDNDGSLQSRLIPITDKNKRILRNKVSVDEILFFYRCADII